MTLTEFLLARIAEDEAAVAAWRKTPSEYAGSTLSIHDGDSMVLVYDPARALAECEAKRIIIRESWGDLLRIEGEWGHGRGKEELSAVDDYPEQLRALGLVYVDHPDYEQKWLPS